MPELLTKTQARAALSYLGKSIRDFALENHLDEPTVYQVLSGKKKGTRGEAHRAAVLLGLKAGPFEAALQYPTELQANSSKKLRGKSHRADDLLVSQTGTLPPGIPSFRHDPSQVGR